MSRTLFIDISEPKEFQKVGYGRWTKMQGTGNSSEWLDLQRLL